VPVRPTGRATEQGEEIRALLAEGEEPSEALGARGLRDGVQAALQLGQARRPQRRFPIPCGVADVQDDVGDGAVGEGPELLGKLKLPGADDAVALEREEPLVAQVRLEKPGVGLPPAEENRLARCAL
jgi:hypothetical protein